MTRTKPGSGGLSAELAGDVGLQWPRLGAFLLGTVIAAALGFRLLIALGTDFPVGDGALFYDFIRALAETFPRLPASIAYNGIDIPFAYPPLSFWAAAGLSKLGIDPLRILHWAPIAMNAAYVLLFAALLLRHGHSRLFAAVALLVTFTALRSFEWLVMGGGLSRGAGSLFALLSLIAVGLPPAWATRTETGPSRTRLILAGLCIGLAILSHLEWGILATAFFVTSRALGARGLPRFVGDNLLAGATALLVVLPWVGLVVQAHGLDPFVSAGGSTDWSLAASGRKVIGAILRNGPNIFMLLGLFTLLIRRDYFWPIFVALCMLLTPRSGDTPFVLAVGAMSAHGLFVFVGLLRRARLGAGTAAGVTAIGLALVIASQIGRDRELSQQARPLSPARLEAMNWVAERHRGRTYAVVTHRFWAYDFSAEWLPTLTGARSVSTVQGREWLPNGAYHRWQRMNIATLQAESCPALLDAVRAFGAAEFVWVETSRDCFRLPQHRPVFRNAEVTIFRVEAAPR